MSRMPAGRPSGVGFLATGAVLAGLGVAAGSLGAHVLKDGFSARDSEIWDTAANYQMYHALSLVVVARLLSRHPIRLFTAACGLFTLGILLFSGSLYGLAITGAKSFGLMTPLGGIFLLGGWGCLAVGIVRSNRS